MRQDISITPYAPEGKTEMNLKCNTYFATFTNGKAI